MFTPHRTAGRATRPLDVVRMDTAGPYPSLGKSRYVVMFVEFASRLQRPYGTRGKSASAVLAVVKRFEVDMGIPRVFHTDNETEYSNGISWTITTLLVSDASSQLLTLSNRMVLWKAQYLERSWLGLWHA